MPLGKLRQAQPRVLVGGTCGVGWGLWVGGSQRRRNGGQFLVAAVWPGAGVAGQALSPQSLPVAHGNESPKNRQGQLHPSPGTEVTDAVRSPADPQASLNWGGWMGCRESWGSLCSLPSGYGMPCAPPVPASPFSPCTSIIVPILLWCTLLHIPCEHWGQPHIRQLVAGWAVCRDHRPPQLCHIPHSTSLPTKG